MHGTSNLKSIQQRLFYAQQVIQERQSNTEFHACCRIENASENKV